MIKRWGLFFINFNPTLWIPCLFGTVSCNDCVEHVYGHSILDNTDIYLFYPFTKSKYCAIEQIIK